MSAVLIVWDQAFVDARRAIERAFPDRADAILKILANGPDPTAVERNRAAVQQILGWEDESVEDLMRRVHRILTGEQPLVQPAEKVQAPGICRQLDCIGELEAKTGPPGRIYGYRCKQCGQNYTLEMLGDTP